MSAASQSVSRKTVSGKKSHTLFWPVLVLIFGIGTQALYQVMALEDQLDEVTRAIDQMDGKKKHAEYEKDKFYAIARGVLRLAPKNEYAEQVVTELKIRQLQAAQPALFALDLKTSLPELPTTNAVPVAPAPPSTPAPTNMAPINTAPSGAK